MTVFSFGLAFCSWFLRSFIFLLDWHGFSDKFVNTVHSSNPRYGSILKQRLNPELQYRIFRFDCILLCPRRGQVVHCFGSTILYEFLLDLEASYILGIKIDFQLLLVSEEHRRIVQFRLISNLLRSIVWITSGLLTMILIVARILASGFPVALHWLAFRCPQRDLQFLFQQTLWSKCSQIVLGDVLLYPRRILCNVVHTCVHPTLDS